jgi:hypothetical protein
MQKMLRAHRNYFLSSFYVKQIPTEITVLFSILQKWPPDEKFTDKKLFLLTDPQEVHQERLRAEKCELTCAKCFVMYILVMTILIYVIGHCQFELPTSRILFACSSVLVSKHTIVNQALLK